MEIVKIIGIAAILVFLVAYIGEKTIGWFVKPCTTAEKIDEILGYVANGSFALASACGIIFLFS